MFIEYKKNELINVMKLERIALSDIPSPRIIFGLESEVYTVSYPTKEQALEAFEEIKIKLGLAETI